MPNTYTGIQALRFVAALMVVLSHATTMMVDHYQSKSVPRWITGHAGVDIFFVISGFVMFFALQPLRLRTDGWQLFLVRRLIRIVPLYWLATTLKVFMVLALPSVAADAKISLAHLAASYFFLPSLAPSGVSVPFMPVGWTLNYEMFFYVICSIALFVRVSPFQFASIILSCLVALGIFHPLPAISDSSYTNPIVLEFLFGMTVAIVANERPRIHSLVLMAVIAVGFVGIFLTVSDGSRLRPLMWGVPAALIVFGVALLENGLREVLPRTLLLLGDSSYALYLIHSFAVPLVGLLFAKAGHGDPWIVIATAVLFSISLSVPIHRWLEVPLMAWLKPKSISAPTRKDAAPDVT